MPLILGILYWLQSISGSNCCQNCCLSAALSSSDGSCCHNSSSSNSDASSLLSNSELYCSIPRTTFSRPVPTSVGYPSRKGAELPSRISGSTTKFNSLGSLSSVFSVLRRTLTAPSGTSTELFNIFNVPAVDCNEAPCLCNVLAVSRSITSVSAPVSHSTLSSSAVPSGIFAVRFVCKTRCFDKFPTCSGLSRRSSVTPDWASAFPAGLSSIPGWFSDASRVGADFPNLAVATKNSFSGFRD